MLLRSRSTIPASATEHFTTGVGGQTNVAIHVVQGERELAKDCRSLARFDLKGIPPMMAGLPRIEVKFLIDANGILHVSAREQRSGQEAEVEVKPTYGLTDEQVEEMILSSFDNAEEDIRARQVIEAKNEAETILAAVEKGKSHASWQQLSADEIAAIHEREETLKVSVKGGDYRAIRNAIDGLDKATRRFAELMMDSAVTGALGGKTMEAAGESIGEGVKAPHPFAAALLVDFYLTEGQKILADRESVPVDPSVKAPPDGLILVDLPRYLDESEKWLRLFNQTFVNPPR